MDQCDASSEETAKRELILFLISADSVQSHNQWSLNSSIDNILCCILWVYNLISIISRKFPGKKYVIWY